MSDGPWRPRLRMVLLASHLAILILTLSGVAALRLYENVLIRRTESALLGQGALVTALYEREIIQAFASQPREVSTGMPRRVLAAVGDFEPQKESEAVLPVLDLSTHPVLPQPLQSSSPSMLPHPLVTQAAQALKPILKQAVKQSLAGIRLLDSHGTVVANTHGPEGGSVQERGEVIRALEGHITSVMRRRPPQTPAPPLASISRGTGLKVYVVMPVISGDSVLGAVLLVRTPPSLSQTLYAKRYSLGIAAMFLIGLVMLLAIWSALTVTRPMVFLVRYVRGIEEGHSLESLDFEPVTREISDLQKAIARMSATLKERGEYIETFARDVSHEFKSPLTSIRGAGELLLDHFETMEPVQRRQFLENIDKDARRLQRLVDKLLEMAKADVVQPGGGSTELRALLNNIIHRHQKDSERLSLECPQSVLVGMQPELLAVVLGNLVDNALLHSGGGMVSIRVKDDGHSFVEIEVEDSGPGISTNNATKVFKPFFTTKRNAGGTGLGLSIARKLVRSHGGDVYLKQRTQGALFVVQLPYVGA